MNDKTEELPVTFTNASNEAPSMTDNAVATGIVQTAENEAPETCLTKFGKRLMSFFLANEFLILVVLGIALAKVYPPLGAVYLKPQITATWIALIIIFLLAGLALRTDQFVNAFKKVYFNAYVQLFNFFVISSVVFGFSRLMIEVGAISKIIGDGMAICGCLPITVNMTIVLTKAAGADEAAAVFNTAFSNMVGIFLSPLLIIGYIGASGTVPVSTTFYQLALRVLLPVAVGQVLQRTSSFVVGLVKKYKKHFLRGQEYALVFIIYCTFCKTFSKKGKSKIGEIFLMILFQFVLLAIFTTVSWYLMRLFFRDEPKLRVMGLFGSTQKTIAVGVPLITSIYAGNPNLGLYLLPLLVWYPMQLLIGTLLLPRLQGFIDSECDRLGIVDDADETATEASGPQDAAAPHKGQSTGDAEQGATTISEGKHAANAADGEKPHSFTHKPHPTAVPFATPWGNPDDE